MMRFIRPRAFRSAVAAVDAVQVRAESRSLGHDHGRRGFPDARSGGVPAVDHVARAAVAFADTAAVLVLAEHLTTQRVRDDRKVAKALVATVRRTGNTAARREVSTEQSRRASAVEAATPVARGERPWPTSLRLTLIAAMAAGGAADLAAGMAGVTDDAPTFTVVYAVAVGVGLVALGASIGHLLKRWELNRLGPDEYVAAGSRVPLLVAAIGLVFFLGLVLALASIRQGGRRPGCRRPGGGGVRARRVRATGHGIRWPGGEVGLGDPDVDVGLARGRPGNRGAAGR